MRTVRSRFVISVTSLHNYVVDLFSGQCENCPTHWTLKVLWQTSRSVNFPMLYVLKNFEILKSVIGLITVNVMDVLILE